MTTNDPVPGLPGIVIGQSGPFDTAVMDRDGNLLFRGRLLDPVGASITALNDRVLLYGRSAADLRVIARSGDQEPSNTLPGVTLNSSSSTTGLPLGTGLPSSYRVSPTGGFVMYGASLNGPGMIYTGTGTNNTAIYWGTPNAQQILVRRGDTAPSGGATYNTAFSAPSIQSTALNGNGIAIFKSVLLGGDVNGTVNDNAWFMGTPGNLSFLIREGDALANGTAIGSLGFNCCLNEAGQVLHDETLSTTLGTTPATTADDSVILITTGGNHAILAREGDVAPNTGGAIYTGSLTIAQGFTDAGEGAFVSKMVGGNVVAAVSEYAAFGGTPGNLQMYARQGDFLQGMAAGETLATLYTSTAFTGSEIAFVGLIAGPGVTTANNAAIFAGPAGAVRMIAREGDAVPGVAGAVIGATSGSGIVNGTGTPVLNDRGQIVFQTGLLVNGTTNVSAALFTYSEGRGVELQLASNESFGTNPYTATVSNITSPMQFPNGDNAALGFNRNGDFVARPFFTGSPVTSCSAIVKGHIGGLQGSPDAISASAGGAHTMSIDAGASNAGQLYLVAGTASGTRPGFSFAGQTVPLNADFWFNASLAASNTVMYANSLGFLDGTGKATATFNFPPFAAFAGLSLHHAFVVIDLAQGMPSMISEPKSLLVY